MRFHVQVGSLAQERIEEHYPADRADDGRPSRVDFEDGPLAAARLQFEHFEELPEAAGPSVRQCHVLVPGFTPVVFIGILVKPHLVEIAAFDDDPDYWDLVENDPCD